MDVSMFHTRGDIDAQVGKGREKTCWLALTCDGPGEFTLHTNTTALYELGMKIVRAAVKIGAADTEEALLEKHLDTNRAQS